MDAHSIGYLIFAILLAIYAIISIVRKKLCIVIVGKTPEGERKWTKCCKGRKAIIGGFVILLGAIGLGLWAILA